MHYVDHPIGMLTVHTAVDETPAGGSSAVMYESLWY